MRLVVLERIYGPYRPEDFTPAFLSLCQGLEVDVKVIGTAGRGWLVVELKGEDEEVARRLLEDEMGLAPVRPEEVGKGSVIRGRIISVKEDGLLVDIGVFEPYNLDALVPLDALRCQLANGLDLDMEDLSSLFCLVENLPLEVKLLEEPLSVEGEPVRAELSEGQVREIEEWACLGLDRLVVTGVSYHAVKKAVGGSGLFRHVVRMERLGILENCLILKLGASVRQFLRVLERRLRNAKICVFRPRKILKAVPGRYTRLAF